MHFFLDTEDTDSAAGEMAKLWIKATIYIL